MNSFWFYEKCQPTLFMKIKNHHVLTANKTRKKSTSSLLQLQHCLHLSKFCVPISLPWGRAEGEDRGHAISAAQPSGAAQLSATAQLKVQVHCLSISFQVTSINILFSPCQVPGLHPHLQPSLDWQLSLYKCFISRVDGYLGTTAPVIYWIEHHTHLI